MQKTFKLAALAIALTGCATDSEPTDPTVASATDQGQLTTTVQAKLALPAGHDVVARGRQRINDRFEHLRMRQTYRGVPVLHAGATAVVENGEVTNVLDHTDKTIDLDVTPRFSKEDAIASALADHGPDDKAVVEATLVIDRDQEKQIQRTRPDEEPVNRDEVTYVTKRHVLTWQVAVASGHEAMLYIYDAQTGALRDKRDPASHDNVTITGNSFYQGTLTLAGKTNGECGAFELIDWKRGNTRLGVYDTDTVFFSGNSIFGDGKVPTADFSDEDDCDSRETKGNNQTAGVDAEFSHAVVWDLFKNVVGLAGWGRDGTQGTDIYTHWQEKNSEYVPTILTAGEHINLGDGNWKAGGSPHTSMSVVGHEFTHGMDHDFGTLALTGPNVMSEGIADIGGVLAQIYQRSHGFANHDTGVTDTGNLDDFTVFGEILATATSHHSKRFLDRPSLDGESTDVYFDGIEDMEPHAASGPIRRAFYYIMKGASAHDDWDHQTAWRSNTPLLPWGLPGLGVDKGADIYFDTFFGCMDDSDFDQARTCAVQVANELFGSAAAQTVKNAFAGVNVGATAGYPRAPAAFAESEPNETNGIATPVDWASPPAGFEGVFKMDLVGTLSGPSDIDEYKFSAKCGRHIGAQVSAFSIGAIGKPTMRLFWLDTSRNVWVAEGAASDPSGHDTLSVDASGFCSGTAQQQFILKVTSGSGNATGFYDVHIDAQ